MSKYIEFKQISFKGKTKKFEVVSKTSFKICYDCYGGLQPVFKNDMITDTSTTCPECNGTGEINIILGRISWYSKWRQYCFTPMPKTVFNRTCMEDIIFFITNLMKDRKIVLMKDK